MSMLPVAGVRGQVPPRRPGAPNPKPGIPKLPVVRGGAPHRARTSSPKGVQPLPAAVREGGATGCGGPARLLLLLVPLSVPANPWFDDTP